MRRAVVNVALGALTIVDVVSRASASAVTMRARAMRAYVADAMTCGVEGRLRDEASSSDRDGGGARVVAAIGDGGDGCAVDARGLALGEAAGRVEAMERSSAADAEALARTMINATTTELWLRNDFRAVEELLIPIFSVRDDDDGWRWMTLWVNANGDARMGGDDFFTPKSFSLEVDEENQTHVVVIVDDAAVKTYVNAALKLQMPRGDVWRLSRPYARARIVLGGRATNADIAWSGTIYAVALYPFALTASDIENIYAAGLPHATLETSGEIIDIDVNRGEAISATFDVETQIEFDSDRLDALCDENESSCDLYVDSELIILEWPLYGTVYSCGYPRSQGNVRRLPADELCYLATNAPSGVDEHSMVYRDAFRFEIAGISQSPRFKIAVDVHKGVLACDVNIHMDEGGVAVTTLQIMNTGHESEDTGFIVNTFMGHGVFFFENGTTVPIYERIVGHACGAQPACKYYSVDQQMRRWCLNVVIVPLPEYFNAQDTFLGPEYPPWEMKPTKISYSGFVGEHLSKPATLNITVSAVSNEPRLRVNRSVFTAKYLDRVSIGTFRIDAGDYDSRASRVAIRSAKANLLSVSNLSAVALCENPFVAGDGTGNDEIVFDAVPSVIASVLNSLVYVHIKRGATQDEVRIEVGAKNIVLIALLGA